MHCGSMIWAEKRFSVQPLPKGPQASRWALASPHFVKVWQVHSLARFRLGDPVSRGPITSVRYDSVAMTWE